MSAPWPTHKARAHRARAEWRRKLKLARADRREAARRGARREVTS